MEYLYINNSFCAGFQELKKLLSDPNNQKNKKFRNEVLAFFRDDVLEKWLMHHGIKENELHLPDKECTDDVCFKSLVKAITGMQIDSDICSKFNEIGELIRVESEGLSYPIDNGIVYIDTKDDDNVSLKVVFKCLKPENNEFSLSLGTQKCVKNWKDFNRGQEVVYEFHAKKDETYSLIEGANNHICEIGINPDKCVDLGLPSGLLWATCNIGATSPEESGDYFSWGGIDVQDSYITYNSYCGDSYEELTCKGVLSNGVLASSYDVATKKMGRGWRMPTANEFNELINECSWEWTNIGKVYGYLVKSKKNNNWIFFPAAGYFYEQSQKYVNGSGHYWSSSVDTNSDDYSMSLHISYNFFGAERCHRFLGFPIRPVRVR